MKYIIKVLVLVCSMCVMTGCGIKPEGLDAKESALKQDNISDSGLKTYRFANSDHLYRGYYGSTKNNGISLYEK